MLPGACAGAANRLFGGYRRCQTSLRGRHGLRILFSNRQDWQPAIQNGFRCTRHSIVFDAFSPEAIKAHDLVIPLTISDLLYVNDVRALVADNPIPIPSRDCILLCDDKYLLNQELTRHGFGSLIPRMGTALPYPYILKPRTGEWGRDCHIVTDKSSEARCADLRTDPNRFAQAFVTGADEYAAHILFRNHAIVCALTIKYVFAHETPIKGRDSHVFARVCRNRHLDVFTSILSSIGFDGLCCINYKVRNGHPWIIEINPRCGGSLCPFLFFFVERAI